VAGVPEHDGAARAVGRADVQHRDVLIDGAREVAHAGRDPAPVDAEPGRPVTERDLRRREVPDCLPDQVDDLVQEVCRISPDDNFLRRIDVLRRAQPRLSGDGRTAVGVRGVEDQALSSDPVLRPDRIGDRVGHPARVGVQIARDEYRRAPRFILEGQRFHIQILPDPL
jgi:hypothetical protein